MATKATSGKRGRDLEGGALEMATLLTEVIHASKRRSSTPLEEELKQAAEREQLGPRHAPVLFAVALQGGRSVSELSRQVGLSVATTSLLVGELSRAGLVTRTEDENDRRRTIVTIPDELEEKVSAWVRQVVEPMRRTLERLSPRSREEFMAGLRLLAEESSRFGDEVGDDEPGSPC
ncbi:MAG: MarR family winged helix-turn-helix transcriptional regulator [Solirubrobacterales bacterium]